MHAFLACGDVHENVKCPMKVFFNMLRKCYVSTKHAGLLPTKAHESIGRLQVWNLARPSVLGHSIGIHEINNLRVIIRICPTAYTCDLDE